MFANWRTTFHPKGAVTAEIGSNGGDRRLPAVVVSGRCQGPFESFELEIPPPENDLAGARVSGQRLGWLNR